MMPVDGHPHAHVPCPSVLRLRHRQAARETSPNARTTPEGGCPSRPLGWAHGAHAVAEVFGVVEAHAQGLARWFLGSPMRHAQWSDLKGKGRWIPVGAAPIASATSQPI